MKINVSKEDYMPPPSMTPQSAQFQICLNEACLSFNKINRRDVNSNCDKLNIIEETNEDENSVSDTVSCIISQY